MYPAQHAATKPDHPAFIMAGSGETVAYGELERRTNRLAHYFRTMEPSPARPLFDLHGKQCALHRMLRRWRTVGSLLHLHQLLSHARRGRLHPRQQPLADPDHVNGQAGGGARGDGAVAGDRDLPDRRWPTATATGSEISTKPLASFPDTPIADESLGRRDALLFGHDGTALGHIAPAARGSALSAAAALRLPAWHVALPGGHDLPLAGAPVSFGAARGGEPDHPPGRHGGDHGTFRSRAVSSPWSSVYPVTHSQLVPTMFSRMLKLPQEVRVAVRSCPRLEIAIHAAAPCPPTIKEQMIDWWGPIIHEYYGATEGLGFTVL